MGIYVDNANVQFENANSLRAYPFAEDSSLVDKDGRELPRDVVVDVHMVVPCDLQNVGRKAERGRISTVRMTSVHLSPSMVSVCFFSEAEGMNRAMSATVDRSNFVPYSPVRLEKLIGSEDIGGIVTFGDIDFPGFPETYFFEQATVHPGCVAASRPVPLRKFVDLRNGDTVLGDARIRFSGYVDTARKGGSLTLSLKSGASTSLASDCEHVTGYSMCGATPIETINGIRPDADGNIVLWFH